MPSQDQLRERVTELAGTLLSDDPIERFREDAARLASDLEREDAEALLGMLHDAPPVPDDYDQGRHGLTGWMAAWQFACFELVMNVGPDVIPLLRQMVDGEYDWTQGNAVELLVRFAAAGVQRRAIIDDLKARFPQLREETQSYAVNSLVELAQNDERLGEVLEELGQMESFRELVEDAAAPDDEGFLGEETEYQGVVSKAEVFDTPEVLNEITSFVGEIWIEGVADEELGATGGRVKLRITTECEIARLEPGEELSPASLDSLTVGSRVQVGHYSFIDESDPIEIWPEELVLMT